MDLAGDWLIANDYGGGMGPFKGGRHKPERQK